MAYQKPRCLQILSWRSRASFISGSRSSTHPSSVAEIAQDIASEEKIAAVDPVVGKFRLFRKFDDFIVIEFQLAEARRWIDAKHGADLSLR